LYKSGRFLTIIDFNDYFVIRLHFDFALTLFDLYDNNIMLMVINAIMNYLIIAGDKCLYMCLIFLLDVNNYNTSKWRIRCVQMLFLPRGITSG